MNLNHERVIDLTGTVILSYNCLFDTIISNKKNCIKLSSTSFENPETHKLNVGTYARAALNIAQQGFIVVVTYSYSMQLYLEQMRDEYEGVEIAAFFPKKDVADKLVDMLIKRYEKKYDDRDYMEFQKIRHDYKADYSTLMTSNFKVYGTSNLKTYSLLN